jgi:hypothetical protein
MNQRSLIDGILAGMPVGLHLAITTSDIKEATNFIPCSMSYLHFKSVSMEASDRFLFLTLSFAVLLSFVVSDKCDASDDDNSCYNLEEWRQNILCRMQGGTGNGARQNGYLAWALDYQPSDTNYIRRIRYDAMRFFIDAQHELQIDYPNKRPRDREGVLKKYERGLNEWGRKLAELDSSETWTTATGGCGIVGVGFRLDTPCGIRTNNEPNCPIRKPPAIP